MMPAKTTWLETIFARWGVYALHHRRAVLGAVLLLTVLAAPFALRAVKNLDANLFNQASATLPRVRTLRELTEEFGGDVLAAVAGIPAEHTPKQVKELEAFGDLLASELSKVGTCPEDRELLTTELKREIPAAAPWLKQVEYRTGQELTTAIRTIAEQKPYALMTVEDVTALSRLLTPAALAQRMDELHKLLLELPPMSAEGLRLQQDPLELAEITQKTLRAKLAASRQKQLLGADGYFISPDQTTLLILSRTLRPATRLDFNTALMAAVQRAENRALLAFRAGEPSLTTALKSKVFGELKRREKPGALTVGFTGMPAVTIENQISLKQDLRNNTLTSFIGVMLIFVIMFRSYVLVLDVTWTALCAMIWTLAFAGLFRGSISVLGGAFTCILLGIGTDYVTYLYNAYHEFHHVAGLPLDEAIRRTMLRSTVSVLAAAATTVLAFFGACFTRFAGMSEFGLFAGTTLVLYVLVTLLVFPALLPRCSPRAGRPAPVPRDLGVAAWGRLLEKRAVRGWTVIVSAILLALAVALILMTDPGSERLAGVRFDPEMSNLRSIRVRAIPLRDHVVRQFGLGLADLRVVVEAPNEERAFAGADEVQARLKPFVSQGQINSGGSVREFIPSPRQQQAVIAALSGLDLDAALRDFRAAAVQRFGERALAHFAKFIERFEKTRDAVREAQPVTLAELMQGPCGEILGPFVRLDYAPAASGAPAEVRRVRLASSWFPADLNYPPEWYRRVAAALETAPPEGVQIRVTSARMVGLELKESVLHDFAWVTLLVGASVAACLLLAFRAVGPSLLALVPIVYGYAAMLAAVALSQRMGWDFSLNFVNLIMFPLLLGSGVDGGIYTVLDWVSFDRPNSGRFMADTGRAVLCCILTTLVGFGSMLWSNYTGLISLGVAALCGYCGALFGSLITLPAVLGMLAERRKNHSTSTKP
ncbi:MAG: MMPL family transporter [Planctomycetota bacterium]